MLALVGARVMVDAFACGVAVLMTRELAHHLSTLQFILTPAEVETVHAIARHRDVWARTLN